MEIKRKLDDFITQQPSLSGAIAGVHICDGITGNTVYENMSKVRLHPASNMKLLTAAAALDILGETYTWPTEIWIDGEIVDQVLHGNLFIRGKGDPTLLSDDLLTFAVQLYNKIGIQKIAGDVIADDTWYDDTRLSPDMMWLDEHCYYGAQVSALTLSPNTDYDAGTVMIEALPGAVGAPAEIHLEPVTDYVQIINRTKTVSEKTKEQEVEIIRKHGENIVIVQGDIALGAEAIKSWVAVWEPTAYVLHVFKNSLEQTGITISGNIKTGVVPNEARQVLQHHSMTLKELLIPFMKLSNNGHGEMLIKEMGRIIKGEGSWEKGIEVVLELVSAFGIDPKNVLLRDGSGISHVNLITPNQLTNLLFHVQKEQWFDSFYRSLPVAGKAERLLGGTLRARLSGKHVRAKTGTIFGVSTLSGYLQTETGKQLIFSIMLNNLLDEEDGPAMEDAMIDILSND